MDPVELYDRLAEKPFRPMRVFLKDGRTLDIPIRQLCVVGRTFLRVGTQAEEYGPGVWGSAVEVPMEEVLRVEPIGDLASTTSR